MSPTYLFRQTCTTERILEVEADSEDDAWDAYTTPGAMFPVVSETELDCDTDGDPDVVMECTP